MLRATTSICPCHIIATETSTNISERNNARQGWNSFATTFINHTACRAGCFAPVPSSPDGKATGSSFKADIPYAQ